MRSWRTRMFVTDIARYAEAARAHREFFADSPPATSMVEVRRLIHPRHDDRDRSRRVCGGACDPIREARRSRRRHRKPKESRQSKKSAVKKTSR